MLLAVFCFCLAATTVGGLCGIGGGILIKPLLDAMGSMPVATVSFLSGITVLTMSAVSVVKSRNELKRDLSTGAIAALSAAAGGIAGQQLITLTRAKFGNDALLGLIQSAIIGALVLGTLAYTLLPEGRVREKHISSKPLCAFVGLCLGIVSSFLGIGGGPFNVILLRYLFGMDAKRARLNSLLIILCSQAASMASTILRRAVPSFSVGYLAAMIAAGVFGGLLGGWIYKKIRPETARKVFICLTALILAVCVYNCVRFALKA